MRKLGSMGALPTIGIVAAGAVTVGLFARSRAKKSALSGAYRRRARRARRRDCPRLERACSRDLGASRCETLMAACWRGGR